MNMNRVTQIFTFTCPHKVNMKFVIMDTQEWGHDCECGTGIEPYKKAR